MHGKISNVHYMLTSASGSVFTTSESTWFNAPRYKYGHQVSKENDTDKLVLPGDRRVGDRLEYDSNSASRLGAMTGAVCYGSLFPVAPCRCQWLPRPSSLKEPPTVMPLSFHHVKGG